MTKARLAPTLIYSGILISAGLTGCGGDNATTFPTAVNESASDIVSTIPEGQANYTNPDGSVNTDVSTVFNSTATYPIYDPANSDLPLQSDLLFATTTDGTLDLTDSSPPVTTALNNADGFSPVGQIDIKFSGALKVEDPDDPAYPNEAGLPKVLTTANGFSSPLVDGNAAPNIFLIPLSTADSACSASSGPAPINPLTITGVDTSKLATQSVRADTITMVDPNPDYDPDDPDSPETVNNTVLRISPLTPLAPKTKYLVAITNSLLDASDAAVGPSVAYNLLGQHTQIPEVADISGDCIPDELTGSGDFTPVPTQKAIPDFNSISSLVVSGENIARKLVDTFRATAIAGLGGTISDSQKMAMDEFVLTFLFTTGGTETVLQEMAGNVTISAGTEAQLTLAGAPSITAATIQGANAGGGVGIDIPQPRTVDFSFATAFDTGNILLALGADPTTTVSNKMIQGAITLPYYLSNPTLEQTQLQTDVQLSAEALEALPVAEQERIASGVPFSFTDRAFQPESDQTFTTALETAKGLSFDLPIADCEVPPDDDETSSCLYPSYNVTYSYPYVEKTTDVTIPVLVSYPDLTAINAVRSAFGAGSLSKPAGGWPTVIFVPTIRSDRTSVLALANALATGCANVASGVTDCFATVVIDPPLHGIIPGHELEASLLANSLIPDYFNVDLSINSEAPTALAERHFGQYLGSIDLSAFGSGNVPAPQPMIYDNPNTTTVDESEGDSGSLYVNILNFGNTRDNMRQYVMDLLNLNASLVNFDFEGDSDGDLDLDRVYLVATSITGAAGTTFLAINNNSSVQQYNGRAQDGSGAGYLPYVQAAVLNNTGGGLAKLLENSPAFGPGIVSALSGLSVDQGSSTFELFMYSLQNALDSVDPINFAADIVSAGTPIIAHEVVGSVSGASGDIIVPNGADNSPTAPLGNAFAAPLSGTDPLYDALNLTQVGPGAFGAGSVVKFNTGTYVSLLQADPENVANDDSVQIEMITSIIAFFASRGAGSAVGSTIDVVEGINVIASP